MLILIRKQRTKKNSVTNWSKGKWSHTCAHTHTHVIHWDKDKPSKKFKIITNVNISNVCEANTLEKVSALSQQNKMF